MGILVVDYSDILESDKETQENPESEPITVFSSNRLAEQSSAPTEQSEVKPKGYLLITLNHPDTVAFRQATSDIQKKMYKKLWHNLQNTFGIPTKNEYYFEYCKSGRVHLHGILSIHLSKFHIIGLISDFVKTYLNQLPKRYMQYKEGYMHVEFQRYRSPSICCQYKTAGDPYIETWQSYILKDQ